jgi:hypothetical protein
MKLGEEDGPVIALINIDSKEVVETHFVRDVEASRLDFVKNAIKFVGIGASQDAVVCVDCVHCVPFVENTFIVV